VDNNDLVTKGFLKQELGALEQRLDQRFEGRMDALEQRMLDATREMIHDSETRLLKAFYGFADATNKHLAQLDGSDAGIVGRMTSLETRVFEIEKRLNMPPGA
jgi:hypothetical protein